MSRWRREPVVLGVDAQTMVALAGHAEANAVSIQQPWQSDALSKALQDAMPSRRKRQTVRVLLGSDLCRHWTQRLPSGVGSLTELQSIAGMHCAQLFGEPAQQWRLAADWRLDRDFVCAAVANPTVDALERAGGSPMVLESAVMAAVRAGLPSVQDGHWLGFVTPLCCVVVRAQLGQVSWLSTQRRWNGQGDASWQQQIIGEVVRQRLRQGHDGPAQLTLRVGSQPVGGAEPGLASDPQLRVVYEAGDDTLPIPIPGESEAAWAARVGRLP